MFLYIILHCTQKVGTWTLIRTDVRPIAHAMWYLCGRSMWVIVGTVKMMSHDEKMADSNQEEFQVVD